MEEELTKQKIIKSIRVERQLLEDQLEGLSEEQMLIPTLEGGWSIKDIMAHIVSWESLLVQWSNVTLQGNIPQMLPPGLTWDDLDVWNEQMYTDNKSVPLAEVLSSFQSSFKLALEKVEEFSENDLVNPDRFEWREGRPFSDIVSANTYFHYKEHREQINLWRKNLGD